MPEQETPQSLQRILRYLIVAEIVLVVLMVAAAFVEDRFLPPLLQQYQESISSDEFSSTDILWLAVGIPALIVSIVAWIALWRGWRIGRRLYTIGWIAFLPVIAFTGPLVQTGAVSFIDTVSSLVGGVILGLLYFSDLRQQYDRNA